MEIQILLNLSIYYSDGDLTSNKVTVKNKYRGTWEAQLVKHPPLGFGSGGLKSHEIETGSVLRTESAA